jgi:sporulation protein YlmC with PRC-barrel domain
VGRFHGDEIYGSNGRYIGELRGDRLITSKSRTSAVKGSFTRKSGSSYVKHVNHVGNVMIAARLSNLQSEVRERLGAQKHGLVILAERRGFLGQFGR